VCVSVSVCVCVSVPVIHGMAVSICLITCDAI
jgi:hypothetical protein